MFAAVWLNLENPVPSERASHKRHILYDSIHSDAQMCKFIDRRVNWWVPRALGRETGSAWQWVPSFLLEGLKWSETDCANLHTKDHWTVHFEYLFTWYVNYMSTKSKCHRRQFKFTDAPFSPSPREMKSSLGGQCTHPRPVSQLRDPDLSQQGEASLPDLWSASKQPSAQRKTWVPSSKAAQTNILGRKSGAQGQEVSAHQTCRIMRTMETVPWDGAGRGADTKITWGSDGWKLSRFDQHFTGNGHQKVI